MADPKDLQAGDPCPICGGDFAVDETQLPDRVIDRMRKNAAKPEVAERYAQQVREKTEEHGVLHACARCGYRHRFPLEGDPPKGKKRTTAASA